MEGINSSGQRFVASTLHEVDCHISLYVQMALSLSTVMPKIALL